MNLIMGKFQHAMAFEVLRDQMWWVKMKRMFSATKWSEAVDRMHYMGMNG